MSESNTDTPEYVSPWVLLRSATAHPFVYKRMVAKADEAATPGDVVNVYTRSGEMFGRGLFNPRSQIAVRMLAHGDVPVDEGFWRDRLERAMDLRRRLSIALESDAYRLVHAEGDGLSGLVVERYADCLVFEVFSIGMYRQWAMLANVIKEMLAEEQPEIRHMIVRADERIEKIEGFRVRAEERGAAVSTTIREHGIRYRVDISAGHKTGFFCDQRDNRKRFASFCKDAEVLDVCCYNAGFGLCAKLLGKARDVTSVDLDEKAIAVARKNVNLNQTRLNLVHADAFSYMRQMATNKRQYDCVVCDPSKFAITRDDLDEAIRKYHDLNKLAVSLVKPGGILLTCSCSGLVFPHRFLETVHTAARRSNRRLQLFDRTGAAPDHPVMMNCPESEYLKALWFRVL